MTLHLKSRGYPFRPRLLFSSFIVVGFGFPTVYYFRRGQSQFSRESQSSSENRNVAEKSATCSPCRSTHLLLSKIEEDLRLVHSQVFCTFVVSFA